MGLLSKLLPNAACKNCRYFAPGEAMGAERFGGRRDWGSCYRTPHANGMHDGDLDQTATATVVDGSGYAAKLQVLPEHYCSMWDGSE